MIGGTIVGRSTLSGALERNTDPAIVGVAIVGKTKLVTGGSISGTITGTSAISGSLIEEER